MKSRTFGGEESESGLGSRGVDLGLLGRGMAARLWVSRSGLFPRLDRGDGGVEMAVAALLSDLRLAEPGSVPGASRSASNAPLYPQLTPLNAVVTVARRTHCPLVGVSVLLPQIQTPAPPC